MVATIYIIFGVKNLHIYLWSVVNLSEVFFRYAERIDFGELQLHFVEFYNFGSVKSLFFIIFCAVLQYPVPSIFIYFIVIVASFILTGAQLNVTMNFQLLQHFIGEGG